MIRFLLQGFNSMQTPEQTITKLHYHQFSKILDVHLDDGTIYAITPELLRVFSPSAEVRGHGEGQQKLVINKQDVAIEKLLYVGNYAVKIVFDDGHDSGIYSWKYLIDLALNTEHYQQQYADALAALKVNPDDAITIKPA